MDEETTLLEWQKGLYRGLQLNIRTLFQKIDSNDQEFDDDLRRKLIAALKEPCSVSLDDFGIDDKKIKPKNTALILEKKKSGGVKIFAFKADDLCKALVKNKQNPINRQLVEFVFFNGDYLPVTDFINNLPTRLTLDQVREIIDLTPESQVPNLSGKNLSAIEFPVGFDFRGANLDNAVLRWATLKGTNLSRVSLRNVNLRETDLTGANLTGVRFSVAQVKEIIALAKIIDEPPNLAGADLRSLDLNQVIFSGADLSGADLTGADLRFANLSGVNLSGVNLRINLSKANLTGVKLSRQQIEQIIETASQGGFTANFTGADFKDLNLSGLDFSRANFSRVKLSKKQINQITQSAYERNFIAKLAEADFGDEDLSNLDFAKVSLRNTKLSAQQVDQIAKNSRKRGVIADLSWVNLSGVDLRGIDLSGVNFSMANLQDVKLSEEQVDQIVKTASKKGFAANLVGVDLSGLDLGETNLTNAKLGRANLKNTKLSGRQLRQIVQSNPRKTDIPSFAEADFSGQNLSDLDLRELNFTQANFSRANLSGANFNNANLESVKLTDAVISKNTSFFQTRITLDAVASYVENRPVKKHQELTESPLLKSVFNGSWREQSPSVLPSRPSGSQLRSTVFVPSNEVVLARTKGVDGTKTFNILCLSEARDDNSYDKYYIHS